MKLVDWFIWHKLRHRIFLTLDEIEELSEIVPIAAVWHILHRGKPDSSTIWCKLCWYCVQYVKQKVGHHCERKGGVGYGYRSSSIDSVPLSQLGKVDSNNSHLERAYYDQSLTKLERLEVNRSLIKAVFKRLNTREQTVMLRRYGHDETLEEVAAQLGVTRERVRQIQDDAEAKLKIAELRKDWIEALL